MGYIADCSEGDFEEHFVTKKSHCKCDTETISQEQAQMRVLVVTEHEMNDYARFCALLAMFR